MPHEDEEGGEIRLGQVQITINETAVHVLNKRNLTKIFQLKENEVVSIGPVNSWATSINVVNIITIDPASGEVKRGALITEVPELLAVAWPAPTGDREGGVDGGEVQHRTWQFIVGAAVRQAQFKDFRLTTIWRQMVIVNNGGLWTTSFDYVISPGHMIDLDEPTPVMPPIMESNALPGTWEHTMGDRRRMGRS